MDLALQGDHYQQDPGSVANPSKVKSVWNSWLVFHCQQAALEDCKESLRGKWFDVIQVTKKKWFASLVLQAYCQICHISSPRASPALGLKVTWSNPCFTRSWVRGTPTFFSASMAVVLCGNAFGTNVPRLKKNHEDFKAVSRAADTRIHGCLLHQIGLWSTGFPLPVLADGKCLLGSSWNFLEPGNVWLTPSETRGCGCRGSIYLEACRGFAASHPVSLEELCLHSMGWGMRELVQPPPTCCLSQGKQMRFALPQRAEQWPAVHWELLEQLSNHTAGQQVDSCGQ